jgi:hypothetical protein
LGNVITNLSVFCAGVGLLFAIGNINGPEDSSLDSSHGKTSDAMLGVVGVIGHAVLEELALGVVGKVVVRGAREDAVPRLEARRQDGRPLGIRRLDRRRHEVPYRAVHAVGADEHAALDDVALVGPDRDAVFVFRVRLDAFVGPDFGFGRRAEPIVDVLEVDLAVYEIYWLLLTLGSSQM